MLISTYSVNPGHRNRGADCLGNPATVWSTPRRAECPTPNQYQRVKGAEIVPMTAHGIPPCLCFDTQAEEAAQFYASVFKDSKIGKISRYGKEGVEVHRKQPGTVLT